MKTHALLFVIVSALSLVLFLGSCDLAATQTADIAVDATSRAYAWSSSAQYSSTSISPYAFYNNIWGMVSGCSQTLYVNSAKDWYVSGYHPYSTGGIKSYPNISRSASNIKVSNLTCSATAKTTTPSGGIWDQAYDIWVKGSSQNMNNNSTVTYEIMLWTNWMQGKMYPISNLYVYSSSTGTWVPGAFVSNVTVGGRSWNLYVGNNGANAVYSFLATTKTNNSTIDIAAVLKWLQANTNPYDYTSASYYAANGWKDSFSADKGKAYLPGDAYLYQLQYGWEIVSTTATASSSATPSTLTWKCSNFTSTLY